LKLYAQEKKGKILLKDLLICEINIEKSSTALRLEDRFNINWAFNEYNHLEPSFHVRAAVEDDVILKPGEIVPIPTGIYPQLLSPRFEIEIRSLTSLLWEQGLVQADGVTYFPYTFRNEIYILIENKSKEVRTIHPAQKIALFSVKQQPKMVIKWVHQIEESPWKMGSSKSFINKIKKNNQTISKDSQNYERDVIKNIIGDIHES